MFQGILKLYFPIYYIYFNILFIEWSCIPIHVIITFFGSMMYSETTKKYFLFLFKLISQSMKKYRFFSCLLSDSGLVWYDLSTVIFSTRNPFRPNHKLLELSAFTYFLDFRILQVVISSCWRTESKHTQFFSLKFCLIFTAQCLNDLAVYLLRPLCRMFYHSGSWWFM